VNAVNETDATARNADRRAYTEEAPRASASRVVFVFVAGVEQRVANDFI
jgi:hypothetical protein